jgi:hypothetical protein
VDESPKLEAEDWRIQSIIDAPKKSVLIDGSWNAEPVILSLSAVGEYKGFRVGFSLPSAPALFLNLSYKSHLNASEFLDNAISKARFCEKSAVEGSLPASSVYDYLELIMASLVFAYTALESFANEQIPEAHVYHVREKHFTRSYDRGQIERSISLDIKLATILPEVLSVSSPKGTSLWQDYKRLNELRDRIIHMKVNDRSCREPDPKSVWGELLSDSLPKPYLIANAMIGHFITSGARIPRWFNKCPLQRLSDQVYVYFEALYEEEGLRRAGITLCVEGPACAKIVEWRFWYDDAFMGTDEAAMVKARDHMGHACLPVPARPCVIDFGSRWIAAGTTLEGHSRTEIIWLQNHNNDCEIKTAFGKALSFLRIDLVIQSSSGEKQTISSKLDQN